MIKKSGAFIVLIAAIVLAGCNRDGSGPPMIPGEFPHGPVVTESDGGVPCLNCHDDPHFIGMTGLSGYHHYLNNDSSTAATISSPLGGSSDPDRNCLMCHVDHDIFRSDLNPNSGGRAYNLRISAGVPPTTAAATFANRDFDASHPDGGICISCHGVAQNKAYVLPDGTTVTPVIDRNAYAAATDGHNFVVNGAFVADASTFQANCTKCHEDGHPKPYQNGAFRFGLHDSLNGRLHPLLNASFTPADPPTAGAPNLLEEHFCFNCHGVSPTYTTSPGTDLFSAASMSTRALNMGALFADTSLVHGHPVSGSLFRDLHRPSGGNTNSSSPDDLNAGNRHAECVDCHNPHAARPGVHTSPGNGAGPVLNGTWGVEPQYGAGTTPSFFNVVGVTKGYQLCMKCHSSYCTGYGTFDKSVQFSPNNGSYHPVVAAGTNGAMPNALLNPWTSTSTMACSDCHGNSKGGGDDPRGPHASAHTHLLKKPYTAPGNTPPAGDLCFDCHDYYTYTRQGSQPGGYSDFWSNFRDGSDNLHESKSQHRRAGCGACHTVHGSSFPHLLGIYNASTNPNSRLTALTIRTPGNWNKDDCTTNGGGCH
ncbi:MAG: hypothetical protein ACYS47_14115 [Planctomycetota bacterium]|jgi:nitrate reductase cytochrome c-type subunit